MFEFTVIATFSLTGPSESSKNDDVEQAPVIRRLPENVPVLLARALFALRKAAFVVVKCVAVLTSVVNFEFAQSVVVTATVLAHALAPTALLAETIDA